MTGWNILSHVYFSSRAKHLAKTDPIGKTILIDDSCLQNYQKKTKHSSKVWIKAQNSISSCLASIVRFAMYVAWETGGKGKPGAT